MSSTRSGPEEQTNFIERNDSRSSPELLQINEEERDLDLRFKKAQEEMILNATVKPKVEPEASGLSTSESKAPEKPAKSEEDFDVVSPESIEQREQIKRAIIGGSILLAVVLIGGFLVVRKLRK